MTLAELPKNQPAVVAAIEHDEEGHWRKLTAFGIMPGIEVEVRQKWPAIVVRAGMTEVGLDETTARLVQVR